ncbi:hypothetical protein EZ456_00830 [Pedobacter psychrodurus]|uniref:Class I lanthipeptide n=1 Tax=Pedobacter psychrodurus TaxID=2530456 RepID=A0A4R0Q8R5_9SPHI|nr:class I lanthipeptide [Pedobacter psychrodurus]TCD29592.1 hypothetical protein EZ456_00830 [Pedobacter psychrodurus]
MKKQFKTKLSLNKETVAKLNEEQMELVAGGQAAAEGSTIVIGLSLEASAADGDSCGKQSIIASRTCPATSTCECSCK